jgi:galactose oxidase-like protein
MTLRRAASVLLAMSAAAGLLTCSDDPVSPSRPTALMEVAGDDQVAAVDQTLPESLVVEVEDAEGQPVAGVTVTWVAGGGGTVSAASTRTGTDGLTAVARVLGDVAGRHTTTATVPDLEPVVFNAVAEAGPVPHLLIATQPSASAATGAPLARQPVLRVLDGAGDPLGAGIEVTASVQGADLGGTTAVPSDASGTVTFTDLALSGSEGSYQLTFSAPDVAPVQSTAIDLSAPAAGGTLVIATQPSASAENGVALARQPVIKLRDQAGAPVAAGVPVSVQVQGATLTGTTSVQTDAAGEAAFTDLALTGAGGTYKLTFGAPDFPSVDSDPIELEAVMGDAGRWTAPFAWPVVGVHMILLPDGRVLTMGRVGKPHLWDPATGTFTETASPAWLFCSGHTQLADGRILIAGGHISDHHGLPNITFFSDDNGWGSGTPMARGRWYPSATTMGNGDVVITAGEDQNTVPVDLPEVWSNGSIRQLTGASRTFPFYPRQFVAPDGRLYAAGPERATFYLSLNGSGAWTPGPPRVFGGRNYGSAVMYDDGKILYAGGAYTTNTAETIDLNAGAPAWQFTGSMAFARRHLNLTVLPTGEVLATGGVAGTGFNDISQGVHAAEIWNPGTGAWTTMSSSSITRGYHATALLLPDGRVIHAGSGDGAGAPNERNAEIFSPPYLFRGARPGITSIPDEVSYAGSFRVATPDAGKITHVSFIRLGAVTHAFDQGQRFQRLRFDADGSGLTVTAPRDPNRAPPGYYLLFILNGDDVPSVGRIIRLH